MTNFNKSLDVFVNKVCPFAIGPYTIFFVAVFVFAFRQHGFTITTDLTVFYEAAKFALSGQADKAYDPLVIQSAVKSLTGYDGQEFGWFYPPLFQFIVLPLAFFKYHYVPLLFLFMLPTVLLFSSAVKPFVPKNFMLVVFSFAPLWFNLLRGQNAFLTGGLLLASLYFLLRKTKEKEGEVMSGLMAGLLSVKPQFCLILPVIYLVRKKYVALFVMVSVALIANLAASLLIGSDDLVFAWIKASGFARRLLETDGLDHDYWVNMPTMFSFIMLSAKHLGFGKAVSLPYAYGAQFATACLSTTFVAQAWMKSRNEDESSNDRRVAISILATLMISPYLMVYDLTVLAVVVVFLLRDYGRTGSRISLAFGIVLWSAPLPFFLLSVHYGVQLVPVVMIFTLFFLTRITKDAAIRNNIVKQNGERRTGMINIKYFIDFTKEAYDINEKTEEGRQELYGLGEYFVRNATQTISLVIRDVQYTPGSATSGLASFVQDGETLSSVEFSVDEAGNVTFDDENGLDFYDLSMSITHPVRAANRIHSQPDVSP